MRDSSTKGGRISLVGPIFLTSSDSSARRSVGTVLVDETGRCELNLAVIPNADHFLEFDTPTVVGSAEASREILADTGNVAENGKIQIGEVSFDGSRATARFFGMTDFNARFFF